MNLLNPGLKHYLLGSVADIERTSVAPDAILEGTTYVGLEHIDSDGCFVGVKGVSEGELASSKFRFGPNHLLFGKLRPYLKKTARPDFEGICSTDILPILPGPLVDRDYLFYFLRHPKTVERAVLRCAGANLPRLSPRDLEAFEIPLPPLPEQRRIAAILDKADAIRRKRREAIALTEELLRATFLEMFGDPVTNPKGWPMSTFGKELELLEYGPRFYNEKYSQDGIRIVRITDLNAGGHLDFSAMPRLQVSEIDCLRYRLRPGDVIFARSGATVGKTAISMPGDPDSIPGAYFIRLRFNKRVVPLFARQVLVSERIQQIIISRSRQSAQQNFSGPGIRELPLPLPPPRLQERLERVWAAQRIALQHFRLAEIQCRRLFDSLVNQSLAGSQ